MDLSLTQLELQGEVAARTALRGQVPGADPATIRRYETALRLVGAALDGTALQSYALTVTPALVVVEGSARYYRLFSAEELTASLQGEPPRGGDDPAPHP